MNSTHLPVISAEQTGEILRHIDVPAVMKRIFTSLAAGEAVQPAQKVVLLPDSRGDFISYFGVDMSRRVIGAKISPYVVTDARPVITAWTLLLSAENGMPLMLCDASLLTTERTAATTALAVDLLARHDSDCLTVIGTGAVGRAHIRHAVGLRKWKEIRIWSRSGGVTTAELNKELGLPEGLLRVCSSQQEAVKDTDVLMLCTSSATPVINLSLLTTPCLITSISTNAPEAHEVSPQDLAQMDVYCDYRHTTPEQAGEMVIANREHGWSRDNVAGDLPELVSSTCRQPDYQRHVFFRSLGLGLEDVAIAESVLNYLQEQE